MGVAVQSSSTISSKVWLCWITRGTLTRKMKYTTYLLGILAYPHTNCISIFIIATIWNTDVVCWTSALTSSRSYRWSWRFQWHVEWFSIIFTGLVGNSTHFLVSSDAYRVFLCSEMMVVIVIDSKVERLKVTSVRHVILQASLWWGKGLSTLYLINSDLPSARKCCSYTITISESCYLSKISPVNARVIVGLVVKEDLSASKYKWWPVLYPHKVGGGLEVGVVKVIVS